ncbi:Histidyl-tRNA synthetase [hydrothermal vent metagenome]|uniref:histidine--tRNA ligase n=1 Tax=hydrothermal vent metagenome TaxID=652676 RepID=A0A3B1ABG9_9ZZZZ
MSKSIKVVRGMHDIVPQQSPVWQHLEGCVRQVVQGYGYDEIRMPIVEKTELFVRTIGEVTDIVAKEMYTFEDRNGDSLSLRPEGTACCVRAGIENGLLYNQIQRLWYSGPMFRHERPQKGRYRQFHQTGVEVYGLDGPDIDAELIMMSARLWKLLGIERLELQINTLGTSVARAAHRKKLIEYLALHRDVLDEESVLRLEKNPLRILDSKNPAMQKMIEDAPQLLDYLDDESSQHFETLQILLDGVGIEYRINPRLVRGLDYYQKTVFEWVTTDLGAQGTVCAGGRYDGLVEQLGGKATPAIGFAMGMERLVALIEDRELAVPDATPHAYFVLAGDSAVSQGLLLAEQLRNALPTLRLRSHCGGGSFKSQMKKADKSGAKWVLILGEDEIALQQVTVKHLRDGQPQTSLNIDALIEYLKEQLLSH